MHRATPLGPPFVTPSLSLAGAGDVWRRPSIAIRRPERRRRISCVARPSSHVALRRVVRRRHRRWHRAAGASRRVLTASSARRLGGALAAHPPGNARRVRTATAQSEQSRAAESTDRQARAASRPASGEAGAAEPLAFVDSTGAHRMRLNLLMWNASSLGLPCCSWRREKRRSVPVRKFCRRSLACSVPSAPSHGAERSVPCVDRTPARSTLAVDTHWRVGAVRVAAGSGGSAPHAAR